MDMRQISFKECLLVNRRAERRCAELFRSLAERLRPADPDLIRRLRALAEEEEEHEAKVAELDQRVEWPLTWHLDERGIILMLKAYFRSLFSDRDRGEVTVAKVRHLVRAVEDEAVRFYQELAGRAEDAESRAVIEELLSREAGHRDALE